MIEVAIRSAEFARSGDPNVTGMATWPVYDDKTRSTMLFNTQSRVENDPHSRSRRSMEQVLKL